MKRIPLNFMTLYADLSQRRPLLGERPGSISTKTDKGKKYLYAVLKDGKARSQRYLGPASSPQAQATAAAIRRAESEAKELRTVVAALKNARIAHPTLEQGRILEVLANAGLFERGMTLVGTVAYQTYACIVGALLGSAAYATNDIDLSVAEFVAGDDEEDIEKILRRADPRFAPYWHARDKLPRIFKTPTFQVDIITRYERGRKSPLPVNGLNCAAAALSYQEYLVEETMNVVALYGPGVVVRIPTPTKFALHKLLIAQERNQTELAKKQKDLVQANELIEALLETDEDAFQDALDEARERGRSWKANINASLSELGLQARQGKLPLPNKARQDT